MLSTSQILQLVLNLLPLVLILLLLLLNNAAFAKLLSRNFILIPAGIAFLYFIVLEGTFVIYYIKFISAYGLDAGLLSLFIGIIILSPITLLKEKIMLMLSPVSVRSGNSSGILESGNISKILPIAEKGDKSFTTERNIIITEEAKTQSAEEDETIFKISEEITSTENTEQKKIIIETLEEKPASKLTGDKPEPGKKKTESKSTPTKSITQKKKPAVRQSKKSPINQRKKK